MRRIAPFFLIATLLLVSTGCSYDALYSLFEGGYTGGGVGPSRRQHYESQIREWESYDRSRGH